VGVNLSNQAGQDQNPTKDAPPAATLLGSAEDSTSAAERERRADENEKANLDAQESVESNTLAMAWIIGVGALIATIALALIFLWRGFRETRRAADTARDQANLSREEFLATHRPKIVVRACGLSGDGITAGHLWPCRIAYTNIGVSTAYIRKIGTRVWNSASPWTSADGTIQFNENLSNEVLMSGEDGTFLTVREFNCDWIETNWFFAGYVEYSDMEEGGTVRKVGFIRRWMGSPGHSLGDHVWGKYGGENEEYEYSH